MIEHITTLEDPRLDVFMRLTEIQLRNKLEPQKGIFIVESDKIIVRALDAGYEPLSLLIPDHKRDAMQALIARIEASAPDIPVFVAPANDIKQLTGYELTRGILCAFRRKPLPSLQDALVGAKRVAVLEDITNHTNIGALFRSAAALNVDVVLLNQGCCDPLYRRAIRVSMGTVFQVPWTRVTSPAGVSVAREAEGDSFGGEVLVWPEGVCACLSELGFATAALALSDDAIALDDVSLQACDKLAVFFGTEGKGLSLRTLKACDYVVTIPMAHDVDSLNVAAASAVTFWELFC